MPDSLDTVRFDRDLLRRYDKPGPRYTSYPTAPWLGEDFRAAAAAARLEASGREGGPLSLYLHLPFCRHRCLFCGCNVVVARDRGRGTRYLELVDRELGLVAELADGRRRRVTSVHLGGGTPTFLVPEDLGDLLARIRRRLPLSDDAELAVEVDPRECSPEHLDVLAAAGASRLSLGVQDLDPLVQAAVRREQPFERVEELMAGARRRGIERFNLDLIYGLPYQSPESFDATLEQVVTLEPDRLAVFNLAYLPSLFAHQRAIDPTALPEPESKLEILGTAIAKLGRAGYVFLGMDHFARHDDPLARAFEAGELTRSFQGYSIDDGADLVGLGVSAISQVAESYYQNDRDLGGYRGSVEAGRLATCRGIATSAEDRLRRDVIFDVLCRLRVDKREVEARHGIAFDRHFADELERLSPLVDDGLVELPPDAVEVTPRGRMLVRNVAMVFDAYLAPDVDAGARTATGTTPSYSRTV